MSLTVLTPLKCANCAVASRQRFDSALSAHSTDSVSKIFARAAPFSLWWNFSNQSCVSCCSYLQFTPDEITTTDVKKLYGGMLIAISRRSLLAFLVNSVPRNLPEQGSIYSIYCRSTCATSVRTSTHSSFPRETAILTWDFSQLLLHLRATGTRAVHMEAGKL